jgi:hypothetical protein
MCRDGATEWMGGELLMFLPAAGDYLYLPMPKERVYLHLSVPSPTIKTTRTTRRTYVPTYLSHHIAPLPHLHL